MRQILEFHFIQIPCYKDEDFEELLVEERDKQADAVDEDGQVDRRK